MSETKTPAQSQRSGAKNRSGNKAPAGAGTTSKSAMEEFPMQQYQPGADRRRGLEMPLTPEGEEFFQTHQPYFANFKQVHDEKNRYFKVITLEEHGHLFELNEMGPYAFAEVKDGLSYLTRGVLNNSKPEQVLMYRPKRAQLSEQAHISNFHRSSLNATKVAGQAEKGADGTIGSELNQGDDVSIENHNLGFESSRWESIENGAPPKE
jgi:hypothetical protein